MEPTHSFTNKTYQQLGHWYSDMISYIAITASKNQTDSQALHR